MESYKVKGKDLTLTLPNNLKDSSLYLDEPFVLFEISNLINEEAYADLVQEMKLKDDYDYELKGQGGKLRRTIGGHNVDKLTAGTFKSFCLAILSREFYNWFKKTHLPYFETKKHQVYVFNTKNIFFRIFRKLCRVLRLPISFYSSEVEYSILNKNSFISPHTDAKTKRLSFVYYLAEEEYCPDIKRNFGTVFHKSRQDKKPWRRFHGPLLDENEIEDFYTVHEPFYVAEYRPNICACFIKNDVSWHSVSNIKYDIDRRVIVINVYES
ncbi:hypothetical protein [Neptuniibacter sp. QD48_11]|uniref:hypothetical protein n=1 Tax=unclassified Neptuniibacter TaxID=2630693 RepID=UPI0039F538EB